MARQAVSAADFVSGEALRETQLGRLQKTVARAYERVALFRERMEERGIRPEHIQTLKDIALLPFTVKTDLRDTYPTGMFASPMAEVVRLHASSGTTGKPIVVGYTKGDIDVWSQCVARALACGGAHAGDVLHNAYGYGLFTGGLGLHYGAEALGATVVPVSGGNTERQVMLMKDFGATLVSCTPSYFLHLVEAAEKMGVSLRDLPLRAGFFGAEPWTDAMRQRIEEEAGIKAFDIYGLTEVCGPGVANECECRNGLHVFEDHFYPEIIHPDTLEPLPDGEEGELVFTSLTKEAFPVIRYRTRDLSAIFAERCDCGRTIRRIRRIRARNDDMLIIRGVNVFPSQVEAALLSVDQTLPHFGIEVSRVDGLDQMEVQVEIPRHLFSDEVRTLEALQRTISDAIFHVINIRVNVTLLAPGALPRSEGKAKRVMDKRG
ncbi:MAG: phenylacetate--CoA ligase [Kiritimatiellaeota bacterium]|nr:phenylacetate--CoA ligase [Kiritimatiellota bacterium]